jgi:undecaprenyl-diphosphatase
MLWIALLLGVVEGLTEFLPISSTGHLILASELVGFRGARAEVFQIFIQLGAILAVVWEYRARLARLAAGLRAPQGLSRSFVLRIGVAFVPFAAMGFLLRNVISDNLFFPATVGAALIAGAVLILVVERLALSHDTREMESTSTLQALGIGLAQCLALWPGFSRAAATILGGLVVGLDRRAATEFSFFLAVPTMLMVTVYKLWADYDLLARGDLPWLALALAVSFVVAWMAIRWLLRYIATHDFRVFAWYRLVLGIVILVAVNR